MKGSIAMEILDNLWQVGGAEYTTVEDAAVYLARFGKKAASRFGDLILKQVVWNTALAIKDHLRTLFSFSMSTIRTESCARGFQWFPRAGAYSPTCQCWKIS